jgi:peptide/nickel transport system substrate-binding protein
MPSSTPLFADQGLLYPYDPAKAKSLLAEAGYGSGFSVSTLVTAGSEPLLATFTAIQQMWANVGVKPNFPTVALSEA